jgi:hypothetical protein
MKELISEACSYALHPIPFMSQHFLLEIAAPRESRRELKPAISAASRMDQPFPLMSNKTAEARTR